MPNWIISMWLQTFTCVMTLWVKSPEDKGRSSMVKIGTEKGLAVQGKECHFEKMSPMWEPEEPLSMKVKVLMFDLFGKESVIGRKKWNLLSGSNWTWGCRTNLGAEEMNNHLSFLAEMNGEERQRELWAGSIVTRGGWTISPPAWLFPAEMNLHVLLFKHSNQ